METSAYNFFTQIDESEYLAYNSRTNALAAIPTARFQNLEAFEKGSIDFEGLDRGVEWVRGGFLVENRELERRSISFRLWRSRYGTQILSLTIAPTLACNFRCVYCYEKASYQNTSMSAEVQDALVRILQDKLQTLEGFQVTWYGGEPLLAQSVMESLSSRFMEVCASRNVQYSAVLVTNGYMLKRELVPQLKAMGISSIQVTIDGVADIHNQRRPLVGGQPTFDRIIENVNACAEEIPIALRVNIDKENVAHNDELLTQLESNNLGKKINIYLGWVEASNGCYESATCLTLAEYSEERIRFANKLIEKGFLYNEMTDYPTLFSNVCCADQVNANVIAPSGDVYSCWGDIGIQEYRMGNIVDQSIQGNKNRYLDFMLYSPLNDPECIECKHLPICMGGCPKRRVEKHTSRCTHVKSKTEAYLKLAAEVIRKRRESVQETGVAIESAATSG